MHESQQRTAQLVGQAYAIVRSVRSLVGEEAWSTLHTNHSRRTLGEAFRVQRECMHP